ncbi:MAG TPA: tRNA dihydrouridine(20/20a) synthase DusA [Steroidobacteraceae bacterium]|nr:tRNA dihydrouridine(20/20a) synthase DusA [Steroidobacteraceae bacterium]
MSSSPVSVAPMMEWTDRHCRFFLRGFSPRVQLYTEMITSEALLRGDAARLLRFDPREQPLALQLGGSDPLRLAAAARLGAAAGYQEINLNCGCPSDRVHAGAFGACLMAAPARVGECVAAMRAAVAVPVTVKMRIGILGGGDGMARIGRYEEADFEALQLFTETVRQAGCARVIVHARQAVLGGLSPKENREVPPLRYEVVQRLKRSIPALPVIVNGGLRTVAEIQQALGWCDGVMLGREAYHRPYLLSDAHQAIFNDGWSRPSPAALLERMAAYAEEQLPDGTPLPAIVRHMLGLLTGEPGARQFRQRLSEGARRPGAGARVIREALRAG